MIIYLQLSHYFLTLYKRIQVCLPSPPQGPQAASPPSPSTISLGYLSQLLLAGRTHPTIIVLLAGAGLCGAGLLQLPF